MCSRKENLQMENCERLRVRRNQKEFFSAKKFASKLNFMDYFEHFQLLSFPPTRRCNLFRHGQRIFILILLFVCTLSHFAALFVEEISAVGEWSFANISLGAKVHICREIFHVEHLWSFSWKFKWKANAFERFLKGNVKFAFYLIVKSKLS